MPEETEEIQAKEPILRFIVRQLFNTKVLVVFVAAISTTITTCISTCNHSETVARQDTIEVKQEKIDSTTTIQGRSQTRRDSINKIRDAKADLQLHYDTLMMKHFNIKF